MEEVNEVNKIWTLENIAIVKFVPMFQVNVHWLIVSVNDNKFEENSNVRKFQ